MESSSSASYSKWDDDRAWSSQEWKTDSEMYERSGRLDETSWRATRKVRPGFSHEETLHDGTAQSVVSEVTPRDSRGDLISILKKRHGLNNSSLETMKQNWILSRIKIIRESGESSGAKKTEENFECYRQWRKTFYDLENVYGCNNGISSIHGKELPEQLSLHCEHDRSHTQTNVRHIYEIGV